MSTLAEADRAQLDKDFAGAAERYRSLLSEDPDLFDAWYGLASALESQKEYAEAIVAYRRALSLHPHDIALHLNLGTVLFALGYVSDAVRNCEIAATASDAAVRAMSLRNLVTMAPGDPALDEATILEIRRAWASQLARDIVPLEPRCRAPNERLKIAYFGAFFADMNWMKMFMGVFNAHDRDRFEIHFIVDGSLPSAAAGYRDHENDRIWQVSGVPNAELARRLQAADIDVLVNIHGYSHTARLPLFLYRPAPVQIAWNGMYGTTGFPYIDLLIGDRTVIAVEEERHYSERIHRVESTYIPFQFFYATPEVAPPPSLRNGYVTFGSLASAYKLTAETLLAWSQILRAVPDSRLLLRNAALSQESNRRDFLSRFASLGIPADRVTLLGGAEHLEFLQTYDAIDIALDTFPYNGGTTTAEALWQGVPLLTTNGGRWAARTSRSLLTAAGLSQWVAPDVPSFVRLSADLAGAALAPIRAAQRDKVAASAACDVAFVCRELEQIYSSEVLAQAAR
jgi:protein O-GlcNAc transferase